jgi:RNA recognition motif-containing protein
MERTVAVPRILYVANLSHVVGYEELEGLFSAHGTVKSARMADRLKTADRTAVGFVRMESDSQGEAAITALDGFSHRGLPMVVRWARPGEDAGLNLSRMFGAMNIPLEGEGHELRGPVREDRGDCGGGRDDRVEHEST